MKQVLDTLGDFMNKATRPFVTNIVVAGLTYGFIIGVVSSEAYVGIAGLVIGFWFQKREEEKKKD